MRLEVGKPSAMIMGYIIEGVYATQEEADADPVDQGNNRNNNQEGWYKYMDIDGDGKITDSDRAPLGNGEPDFVFGFSNTLTWKNFDLTLLITGSYGNEIVMTYGEDAYDAIAKEWTEENRYGAKYGVNSSLGNGTKVDKITSNNVWDGSYIRLKNVRLGYSLPVNKVQWLSRARLYVDASQLFTITNYPGFNPNVSSNNSAFGEGVDRGVYPVARTFMFGANIQF